MGTACYECPSDYNNCYNGCCYTMKIHKKSFWEGLYLINFTEVYIKTYDDTYIVSDVIPSISNCGDRQILTKFNYAIAKSND